MNNMVQISGGNSVQKEIAFKVISKMIDELMPRMKTLDISVKIKKFKLCKEKHDKWTDLSNFLIQITSNLAKKTLQTTGYNAYIISKVKIFRFWTVSTIIFIA